MTRRRWFDSLLLSAGFGIQARSQETRPIGKTPDDQKRNAALLSEYEYAKYEESLTGYTGLDRQRIARVQYRPALRTRIGPRGNYKAGMAMLKDGTLIAASCRFNNATEPKARNFDILIYESKDHGTTWAEVGRSELHGKEPSLTLCPDGTLVLTAQKGYFGPGAKLDEIPVSISKDKGRTWTTKMLESWDYPRNLIVEPDGSLTMITAQEPAWFGEKPGSPLMRIARSRDNGANWTFENGRINWDYRAFGEVSTIRLRNGNYLASLRRQIPGTKGEGYEETVLTLSTDQGKTWSEPWAMSNTGEVHTHLLQLADGRLLATYSHYHLPWGVFAVLSQDNGKTWDHERPYQLALSANGYVGWAVTIESSGRLYTAYAATTYLSQPPKTTTCEFVRWTLE